MTHSFLPRLVVVLLAWTPLLQAQQNIAALFVARSQPYTGGALPYRLYVPSPYDSTISYPLVLALHGSGERGSDNLAQLLPNRLATSWADPANQAAHPCFVVAPQCPQNLDWSSFTEVLAGLVDSLCRQYSIDTERVIITGLSMGGYGTWELITLYPDKFAAAVPMSAGWIPTSVNQFRNVPIWNFHGAIDNTVPVSQSREMINAIEADGRPVVYTHGHGSDYRGLPDSLLADAVRSHDDVFYTEYQYGGHVIWDEAYDTPALHAWVFDHVRRKPGAIHLTGLEGYPSLHGSQTLSWVGGSPTDSIELWWSPDAGVRWIPITTGTPNTGSLTWNTLPVADCGLGMVKVFLKNPRGECYAMDRSGYVRLDNAADGTPTMRILPGSGVYSPEVVTSDSLLLHIVAADPENASLKLTVEFSVDTGRTFQASDSLQLPSDTMHQSFPVHLSHLPNSSHSMLRLSASDGAQKAQILSVLFAKQSPRQSGPVPTATIGGSNSIVKVNVADVHQLTGHLYRVTFYDSAGFKWYQVSDKTADRVALERGTPIDGVSEGPMFDGLRLVVTDYPQSVIDIHHSGWTTGSSSQTFLAFSPVITFDTVTIRGYRNPADYRITIADHVIDTSVSTLLGIPAIPLKFSVWNITEENKVNIGYLDNDGNGGLTNQDELYFLETDSAHQVRLTWGMTYDAQPTSVAPYAGDQFVLRTLKPIRAGDTYEFIGTVSSLPQPAAPMAFGLEQNFPNPFNPTTIIRYTLEGFGSQASGVSNVRLVVFDILGREVAVLVNEREAPGIYEVAFNGRKLSSGVYLYRLTAGSSSIVRKMVLIK